MRAHQIVCFRPTVVAASAGEGTTEAASAGDDPNGAQTQPEGDPLEDSDADPEADVLVILPAKSPGKLDEGDLANKGIERPWMKNVSNKIRCTRPVSYRPRHSKRNSAVVFFYVKVAIRSRLICILHNVARNYARVSGLICLAIED